MKNLVTIYNTVSPSIKLDGLSWYVNTRLHCQQLADRYGIDLPRVVAIFSALSPSTNFEQNKKDCENLIKGNGGKIGRYKFQTYGANVIKAQNIFSNLLEPDKAFSLKTGAKTFSFYRNILKPNDCEHVTIDRHAFRIATGDDYKGLSPKQYRLIAEHYKKAAIKLGIIPCQLQAVLWVNYRIENDIQQKAAPF